MLENHIDKLKNLLKELLDSSMSENEFRPLYRIALSEYENYISDRPYYPLKELETMEGSELLDYASQAFERLPREELDRTTEKWISENLVDGDEFNFDIFDEKVQLYSTNIDSESFLLSSLNGTIKPLSFNFADMLQVLKELSGGELATWGFCLEPDNAFAAIGSVWSLGDVYEETNQLAKIEQISGESVQWGNCYQLLLTKSKKWMLLNHYYFQGFEMSLHGNNSFINKVLSHNKIMNSGAAKLRRL
jgi:hypothetical protein